MCVIRNLCVFILLIGIDLIYDPLKKRWIIQNDSNLNLSIISPESYRFNKLF